MSFGDRLYLESDPIAHYTGHPLAPVQAVIAAAWRAAYFHGQQNGRVLLQQPPNFNVRDYVDEATVRRTVLPTAAAFAGVARGYARIKRGQTVLVATVLYSPRSVNFIRVTHRMSCYAIADDATDIATIGPVERNAGGSGGRFQGPNGTIRGFNSRANTVAGTINNPFTAGFPVFMDQIELPLENVSTDGGTRVRILLELRCNQESSGGSFNVPIHVQPLAVLVAAECRR